MFVALSAAGSLNGGAFARGRMYFVASREGILPEVISMVHIGWKTPLPSMAFSVSPRIALRNGIKLSTFHEISTSITRHKI